MATAFQTIDSGGSRSKKKTKHQPNELNQVVSSNNLPIVPSLSLPKIGTSSGGPANVGNNDHSKLPPTGLPPSGGEGMFPKLKKDPAGKEGSDSSSTNVTARRKHTDEGDNTQQPSLLPALNVSPRIDQAMNALTVKMASNVNSAADGSSGGGKSKREKTSTKKKKDRKSGKENQPAPDANKHTVPHAAGASVASIPSAANPAPATATEDEDNYDDDEYSSPSASASAAHSRANSTSNAVPATTAAQHETAPAPPPQPQQEPKRKVGPSVQQASHPPPSQQHSVGFALAATATQEIGEELDSSFHVPTQTPGPQKSKALFGLSMSVGGEVEEEAGAQFTGTLSPKTLGRPKFDASIADELEMGDPSSGVQSEGENDDESISNLLAGSPGTTQRMHPTSLVGSPPSHHQAHTTVRSPAGGGAGKGVQASAAPAKKKKSTPVKTAAKPPPPAVQQQSGNDSKKKKAAASAAAGKTSSSSSSSSAANVPASLMSPSSRANASVNVKAPVLTSSSPAGEHSPKQQHAAAATEDDGEDQYAENDWRAQTTAFGAKELQGHLLDAAVAVEPIATDASLPAEMIRFTLRPETLRQYYQQANLSVSNNNDPSTTNAAMRFGSTTSLEFSRSQRITDVASNSNAGSDELAGSTRWIPCFQTTLHTQRGSTAGGGYLAGNVGSAIPSSNASSAQAALAHAHGHATNMHAPVPLSPTSFTVDRLATFGSDPNESVLIQLWNTAYSSAAGGEDDTIPDTERDEKSPGSSFNRTLLAEFQTSVKEFAAQSQQNAFDRTVALGPSVPIVHALPPRSALKASAPPSDSSTNGGSGSPPKPVQHVRFFDVVEIFRLSAPLDRTTELNQSVVAGEEEKHSGSTVPSVVKPIDYSTELASLFLTEQAAQRRARSAGKSQPSGGMGSGVAVAGQDGGKGSKKVSSSSTTGTTPIASASSSKRGSVNSTAAPSATPAATNPSASSSGPSAPAPAVRFLARGYELAKMEMHALSNPLLEILIFLNNAWVSKPLYKSETQFGTLDPIFKPFVLSPPQSDVLLDAPLLLKLVHFDEAASTAATAKGGGSIGHAQPANEQVVIGQAITSLRTLLSAAMDPNSPPPPLTFNLIHPARSKLTKRATGSNTGRLVLQSMPPATPASNSRRGSAAEPARSKSKK